jgi:cyclopropane fatty-acyl-phospholipid synthase-like methyltransferase
MTVAQEQVRANNAYYDAILKDYDRFWGISKHHSMHWGYHDEQHRSVHDACVNLNRVMARMANVTSSDTVIDIGCGVGGSAIFLAKTTGAKATGFNINEMQLGWARRFATDLGVSHLTDFKYSDLNEVQAPDQSCTVLWSLESFNYATSSESFAKEAGRLVQPGGRLIVTGVFGGKPTFSAEEQGWLNTIRDSWKCDHAPTPEAFKAATEAHGFRDGQVTDISSNVLPSAKRSYWMSLFGIPYGYVMKLFDPKADLRLAGAYALIAQHKLLLSGGLKYMIFTTTKG